MNMDAPQSDHLRMVETWKHAEAMARELRFIKPLCDVRGCGGVGSTVTWQFMSYKLVISGIITL